MGEAISLAPAGAVRVGQRHHRISWNIVQFQPNVKTESPHVQTVASSVVSHAKLDN
jgi:hypothetical protein